MRRTAPGILAARVVLVAFGLGCAAIAVGGCSALGSASPTDGAAQNGSVDSASSTPASTPTSSPTFEDVAIPEGNLDPYSWCNAVWDSVDGLADFLSGNGTISKPGPPNGTLAPAASESGRTIVCSTGGFLVTRATYDSPAAAQAGVEQFNQSALGQTHVGEESHVTLAGRSGVYTLLHAKPDDSAKFGTYTFSSDVYSGTELVSVGLFVAGSDPDDDIARSAIERVVSAASRMEVPVSMAGRD